MHQVPRPDIHFSTTADGVGIAYWEVGDGPPLVYTNSLSYSHAETEWTVPQIASLYLGLARHFRLIRFDPRGSGLSDDPEPGRFQVDDFCLDIEAVTASLGLEKYALLASGSMGPVGIKYAATHGEVRHLILGDTFAVSATSPLARWMKAQAALSGLGVEPLHDFAPPDILETLQPLFAAALHDATAATPDLLAFDSSQFLGDIRASHLGRQDTRLNPI